MKKGIRKMLVLAGVSILALSIQGATTTKTTPKTTKKTTTKTTVEKPATLGKISMDKWFGLDAEKLKTQVKGTKDVFETSEDGTKVLAGLQKTESWFGASANTFYSLVTDDMSAWNKGELQSIILTYNNMSYNTLIKNMTKSLGEPKDNRTSDSGADTISEAMFTKNNVRYLVGEYLDHVEVIIQYDAN